MILTGVVWRSSTSAERQYSLYLESSSSSITRVKSVDFPTPPCPKRETILYFGSSGSRICSRKNCSSLARPTNSFRVSVTEWEYFWFVLFMKGIGEPRELSQRRVFDYRKDTIGVSGRKIHGTTASIA